MSRQSITATMHSSIIRTRALALGILLAGLLLAPGARAAGTFGISSFATSASSTQAGAHADVSASFTMNTDSLGNPVDQLKDVTVNLPPGVVGNPQAIPKCTDKDFQNFNCPADAQVGVLDASFVIAPGSQTTLTQPNLTPTKLTAALAPCTFIQNGCEADTAVATTAGMASGDHLTIDTGANAEHVTIAQVLGPEDIEGAVTGNGLAFAHAVGASVFDDTITVASTNGFEGFDGGNNVVIGTGATAEKDTVAFAPGDEHHLDLNDPLIHHHAAGTTVVHLATTAGGPIPIFNLQPDPGHTATFAGSLLIATIVIQVDVRTDGSYGLSATLHDISSLLSLAGSKLTFWGVPGDPSHDSQRCGELGFNCQPSAVTITPFMTNPTNCSGGQLTSTLSVDSWQNPSHPPPPANAQLAAPTGCDHLNFHPSLSVVPDNNQPGAPAGYDVDLGVPQNPDAYGLATPDLQNASVTLPAGTALSPAVANGLQGCTDAAFAGSGCPNASKVGSITITSPLVPDQLTGSDLHRLAHGLADVPPVHGGECRQRDDQAPRSGQARPRHRPADGGIRQQPAVAVQRPEPEVLRRPDGRAGEPRKLRHVHDERRHLAVRIARQRTRRDAVLVVRHQRLFEPDAVLAVVHRRYHEPRRRSLLELLADVRPPGLRPGAQGDQRDAAARPVREDRRRPAVPRRQRGGRDVRLLLPGRHGDGRLRCRLTSAVPRRDGVSDRPLQRRCLRARHGRPRGGGAVQPRDRDRPQGAAHRLQRCPRDRGLRPIPDDPRRRPAADQDDQPDARSAGLHHQPDVLPGLSGQRDGPVGELDPGRGVLAVPGRLLRRAAVHAAAGDRPVGQGSDA